MHGHEEKKNFFCLNRKYLNYLNLNIHGFQIPSLIKCDNKNLVNNPGQVSVYFERKKNVIPLAILFYVSS